MELEKAPDSIFKTYHNLKKKNSGWIATIATQVLYGETNTVYGSAQIEVNFFVFSSSIETLCPFTCSENLLFSDISDRSRWVTLVITAKLSVGNMHEIRTQTISSVQ